MKGKVYLVGAGPGGIDLMTARAREVLASADVILYDQLPGKEILSSMPERAVLIDCGKFGSDHVREQEQIEGLMVEHARAGRKVVRLKGGDPFLFGRGGEELEVLRAHGIVVELVPGITSALAVPGSVGIPLTHRKYASQVTILTGHEDPTKAESALDWSLLARGRGTIVILMGVKNLAGIAEALLRHGRDPSTPVAIIERGFRPDQRTTTGRLDEISTIARKSGVRPPAVIVIGEVVSLYRPGDTLLTPGEKA